MPRQRRVGVLALNQPLAFDAEPQFFGYPQAQIFGLFHAPTGGQVRRSGVVICPPLGEEYFAAHRPLRVLATQLARLGFPVMRFDYLGCGDSSGDDLDVTVRSCLYSLSSAMARLRELSGCERITTIGVRFGGTIAAMSASASPRMLHECLLWDPVLDGAAYVRYLQHELHAILERHVIWRPTCEPSVSRIEAAGQRVSVEFEAQLAAILPDRFARLPAGQTLLVDTSGDTLPLVAALPEGNALRHCMQLDFPENRWKPDRSDNPLLVPAAVIRKLTSLAEQRW